MTSFPHPAGITTLHRLSPDAWTALEDSCRELSADCAVTLILPCHLRDLGTAAFADIVRALSDASWIRRLIVGLDGPTATAADVEQARQILTGLPQDTLLLWTGAPEILALEHDLQKAGLTTATSGKGRNIWLCSGLALALAAEPSAHSDAVRDQADPASPPHPEKSPAPAHSAAARSIVAIHDCDIQNYTRELPVRLCHPLMDPRWGFRFNKGFYSRHSDRLHGRLQRLLVRPLLKAMELRAGPVGVLQFLSAFRYPLAGESAVDLTLLSRLNFPATWGLEIGLLEEIRSHLSTNSICQTELCAAYDHKHQDLSPDDPSSGLHRMAREVSGTLLATVAGGTYPWREQIVETWQGLTAAALRHAAAESALNGLDHFPDHEKLAILTFGKALQSAVEEPAAPALLPSWDSASRAVPTSFPRLAAALTLPA